MRNINFSLLGFNANSIANKVESLKQTVAFFQQVTLQETKTRKLGSIHLAGYQWTVIQSETNDLERFLLTKY